MAEGSEEKKMIIGKVMSRGFLGMGVMGKRDGRVSVPKTGVTEVSSAEKSKEGAVADAPEECSVEGAGEAKESHDWEDCVKETEAKSKRRGRRKRKTEEQDG